MKKHPFHAGTPCVIPLLAATFFLNNLIIPAASYGQGMQPVKSEIATCQVNVISKEVIGRSSKVRGIFKKSSKTIDRVKSFHPQQNQLGYFSRVPNILPHQHVPIEIAYPQSRDGEKVVILVADGGTLDEGKTVKVAPLINKKLLFTFKVGSDPGIYRVVLKKGNDTKVVQLWVGAEPTVVKQ